MRPAYPVERIARQFPPATPLFSSSQPCALTNVGAEPLLQVNLANSRANPLDPRSSRVEPPVRPRARIPSNSSLPRITDLGGLNSFRRTAARRTWWYTRRTRVGGPDLQGLPNRPPPPVRSLHEEDPSTNSDRPNHPINFEERFSQALLQDGVRALMLGGTACNVYGSSRHSFDTDWWLDPAGGPEAWAERLLSVVKTTGETCEVSRIQGLRLGTIPADPFAPLRAAVAEAARADGVIRLKERGPSVDVFFEAHNLPDFDAAWKRALPFENRLRVLSLEDLIASKRGTGRTQDEDDLRFLESLS